MAATTGLIPKLNPDDLGALNQTTSIRAQLDCWRSMSLAFSKAALVGYRQEPNAARLG